MTMLAIARHTAQAAELRAYLQAALTVDPWAAMEELVYLADSPCRSRGSCPMRPAVLDAHHQVMASRASYITLR